MPIRQCSDIPPSEITPESVYQRRRELLHGVVAGAATALTGCGDTSDADGEHKAVSTSPMEPMPGKALAVASRSSFNTSETLTSYHDATRHNNFYEFGTSKSDPEKKSGRFHPEPWTVEIAGHAETTGKFSLEDILKSHALEERIYRLRCVEGWSMVIPWIGFPLGDLLKRFKPTSQAQYVAFTTINRPSEMPGLSYAVLDWPYREGLRMDEAMHPLTILAVGLYGHSLPNQNGAPLRLVIPWKYGFKSIKSIVRIEFTENRPKTSWHQSAPTEYGFYYNVNPGVDHPRWSQKTERRISGDGFNLFGNRIPTLPFNGYSEHVAALYAGMDLAKDF